MAHRSSRSAGAPLPALDDIIVLGFSRRFARAVRHVLATEGGFNDIAEDRGGATNWGISLRFLVAEGRIDLDEDGRADFDLDGDGDIDGHDVRRLTAADAVFLYWRCFWQRAACEALPQPIGEIVFDQAVNAGIGNARRMLQRAINRAIRNTAGAPAPLIEDGQVGPRTLAALNFAIHDGRLGPMVMAAAFRTVAADRYRAIVASDPSQRKFLKGWLRRAAALGKGVMA